jgi:N-acetylglucosaminyldiphosphoundecaprenol N-acetyl-beta-D-mannosaminyltransferase
VQFTFSDTVISVNVPNRRALLVAVARRFRAKQGFALATINLDHLVKLHQSAPFRTAYAAQDLIVADGNPIVWLSKLARRPVKLVPGSDVVVPLAKAAAKLGVPVALVGSTSEALQTAAEALVLHAPRLQITMICAPAMGFDPSGPEADQIFQELNAKQIGLCFLALGAPKQEAFAALGRKVAPHVGFASVGAGLDFLAGTQHRAPLWLRKLAMEWAWRMFSSPKRLVPRYLGCAAILPSAIMNALRLRRKKLTTYTQSNVFDGPKGD